MTLALPKSQVDWSGTMQSWNCSSCSFACKCRSRKSGANCCAISLICVTITCQHIFIASFQVMVVAVLPF